MPFECNLFRSNVGLTEFPWLQYNASRKYFRAASVLVKWSECSPSNSYDPSSNPDEDFSFIEVQLIEKYKRKEKKD